MNNYHARGFQEDMPRENNEPHRRVSIQLTYPPANTQIIAYTDDLIGRDPETEREYGAIAYDWMEIHHRSLEPHENEAIIN